MFTSDQALFNLSSFLSAKNVNFIFAPHSFIQASSAPVEGKRFAGLSKLKPTGEWAAIANEELNITINTFFIISPVD